MQYIAAFLLIPSTLILISYIGVSVFEGAEASFLEIENGILNVGFMIVFAVSTLAGWLAVLRPRALQAPGLRACIYQIV